MKRPTAPRSRTPASPSSTPRSTAAGRATAQSSAVPARSTGEWKFADLDGYPFRVRVSSGHEARGHEIATLAADAYDWLAGVMEIRPHVDLRIVTMRDWDLVATETAMHGVPYAWVAGELVTTLDPAPFWSDTLEYFAPDLDTQAWTALRNAYGDPPDLARGMLDMAVAHEVGHIFHLLEDVPVTPRAALAELFANLAMYGYFQQRGGETAKLDAAAAAARCVDVRRLPVSALRDVAVAGQQENGIAVDMWYTFMLLGHAKRVLHAADPSVLGGLQRVIRTELTWEATVVELERVHPALARVVSDWP